MEDQNKFLDILEELKQIAGTQGGTLQKKEIKAYLSDMELTEEQWRAIYQYLRTNQIQIEGEEEISQAEIRERLSDRQEQEIFRFLQGEKQLRDQIIESRISTVKKLAKRYKNRSVLQEELIAEGNLGLMNGISVIEADVQRYLQEDGAVDLESFLGTIEMEIIHAMEQFIDQTTGEQDQEATVLAKMNLLHEAAKYMTEEIGRVPTMEELSEYTKISREEIGQMMGLSEDAKRVASPDIAQ